MFEALFQTFEEPETGVALTARLSAFREELARRNLTGFVVPRADQQFGYRSGRGGAERQDIAGGLDTPGRSAVSKLRHPKAG